MPKLTNGKTVSPDFNLITVREYRELLTTQNQEVEDGIFAKVYGLTAEDILDLTFLDYRAMSKEFFEVAKNPVESDPN